MRLTYWFAPCLDDSLAYSVRARTKREAQDLLAEIGDDERHRFGPLSKIIVEYDDGFDLLYQCNHEGGLREENLAPTGWARTRI
jgi:hypothetical protein